MKQEEKDLKLIHENLEKFLLSNEYNENEKEETIRDNFIDYFIKKYPKLIIEKEKKIEIEILENKNREIQLKKIGENISYGPNYFKPDIIINYENNSYYGEFKKTWYSKNVIRYEAQIDFFKMLYYSIKAKYDENKETKHKNIESFIFQFLSSPNEHYNPVNVIINERLLKDLKKNFTDGTQEYFNYMYSGNGINNFFYTTTSLSHVDNSLILYVLDVLKKILSALFRKIEMMRETIEESQDKKNLKKKKTLEQSM